MPTQAGNAASPLPLDGRGAGGEGRNIPSSPAPAPKHERGAIAIQVTKLSRILGGRTILRELDFQIAEGETIAITGANGAGKTTLLRCLATLTRPTAGQVRWFGRPASDGAAVRRLVGLAAHESFLYPYLTAKENLVFAGRMYGVPDPVARAERLLRSAGLESHADRWATKLSRGVRQRLAVVRAMVHDPPIVLLDEPFSGLDEAAARWLQELFTDLRARRRTVCFTTHDTQTARKLADRIFHLEWGRLVERESGRRATLARNLPAARAA